MHRELERTKAVRDALDVVAQAVGVVVERVDAPAVAGLVMRGVPDAVEQGIAQPHVGRGHVDLAAQGARAVRELTRLHTLEQVEVLGDGAVAVRALAAGLVRRAAVLVGLLRAQVRDIGLALTDQGESEFIQGVEVIAGVEGLEEGGSLRLAGGPDEVEVGFAVDRMGDGPGAFFLQAQAVIGPAGDQPLHVGDDGVDVFGLLLGRVRVVHSQVEPSLVLARDPGIDADRLGVADVEVAVGLGGEARDDSRMALGRKVTRDGIADEV